MQQFLKNIASTLAEWWRRIFGSPSTQEPAPGPETPEPVQRKVSLIIFNPRVPSEGGRRLTEVMGWNDPNRLAAELIEDLRLVSHGYACYEIAERIEVDDFPIKEDSYKYTAEHYIRVMQSGRGFHQPDAVNYNQIITDHNLLEKVASGAIDEVWTVSFPYAGFNESRMAGPEAFWCNAPPLPGTDSSVRRFVIMAFNYERGVGEMLESFGHRAESILERVFRGIPEPVNLWKRFIRYEKTHPGMAEAGNVHFAPNSRQDYDWGNPQPVVTRANTWLNYPDLTGPSEQLDCQAWGGGDIREHHRWWFRLMPHCSGAAPYMRDQQNPIANNWWLYIVDPNKVL